MPLRLMELLKYFHAVSASRAFGTSFENLINAIRFCHSRALKGFSHYKLYQAFDNIWDDRNIPHRGCQSILDRLNVSYKSYEFKMFGHHLIISNGPLTDPRIVEFLILTSDISNRTQENIHT